MKLLALDQASKTSGYSIFQDGKLIDYGHFTVNDESLGARLNKIRRKVVELIMDNDIDYVAFEDIQLQQNVGNNVVTFKALAEVFGVIAELLEELEINSVCVSSNTWKSYCGIKGRTRPEQKRNAQAFVAQTYNVKATQDESDAICIGHMVSKRGKPITNTDGFDWS